MNRIYQGRVSRVQIPKPGVQSPQSPNDWQDLPNGEEALWHHHPLFQDVWKREV